MKPVVCAIAVAFFFCAPVAMARQAPAPEQILADAARYTVKVDVLTDIGLNQDDGESGSGTGFLIDRQRGWLLTNAHVASRSPATITVAFKGGDRVEAKRIHVDPLIDLAVLAIAPEAIPSTASEAKLDCDGAPTSGSSVLAYGHPWRMYFTATRGIVSGMTWLFPNRMIQTDAVINSGNSGGPLISLADGRVIGLNTSTYQPDKDDIGATAIGLAEPMPAICRIVSLLKAGVDTRLRMLPVAVAASDDDLRPHVAQVFQEGEGFRAGDVISRVNGGEPVATYPDLLSKLRGTTGAVTITVERDGKAIDVHTPVRIVADPLRVRSINLSGLIIAEPWKLDDFEVNPRANLIVDWFEGGEEAALTGVKVSDYIVSVGGQEFSNLDALYAYLERLPADAMVQIMLKRPASASEVYREYRHISVSRSKLEWVYADR